MLKQEDLQAEMLISAEAKRLADRYNKDYLDCEDLMKITKADVDAARALPAKKLT